MPTKKPGPSVKDDTLYEKLRSEGNSKGKAARIANAAAGSSRSKLGKKGGSSPSYDEWKRTDLEKQAQKVGIKGPFGDEEERPDQSAAQQLSTLPRRAASVKPASTQLILAGKIDAGDAENSPDALAEHFWQLHSARSEFATRSAPPDQRRRISAAGSGPPDQRRLTRFRATRRRQPAHALAPTAGGDPEEEPTDHGPRSSAQNSASAEDRLGHLSDRHARPDLLQRQAPPDIRP